MRDYRKIAVYGWLIAFVSLFSSCIYDDLSGCGDTYTVKYTVRIIPEVAVEDTLADQLAGERLLPIRRKLSEWLVPMFQPTAKELSTFFHRTEGPLQVHSSYPWQGGDTHRLEFYLPKHAYWHTGVAYQGVDRLPIVFVEEENRLQMKLSFSGVQDTIDWSPSALFVGHQPVVAGENQLVMKMRNAAVVLVLTTRDGNPLGAASVYLRGMAGGWSVADCLPLFEQKSVIHAQRLDEGDVTAFYTATFPSRCVSTKGTVSPWEMDVYIRRGASVTKNLLVMNEPVSEGELCVIRLLVDEEGRVQSDSNVTVSVELNWKPGFDFDLDI